MAKFATPAAEESVGCNLIPMIDIMFLLLLFFMLGADMTQREMEEVALPHADRCLPDEKDKSGPRTTVNIRHRGLAGGLCAAHSAGTGCMDDSHWVVTVSGQGFDLASVEARLRIDALRELEPLPPPPPPKPGEKPQAPRSGRAVMIRADAEAPFGHIRAVMTACANVGIYKVKVGATQTAKT